MATPTLNFQDISNQFLAEMQASPLEKQPSPECSQNARLFQDLAQKDLSGRTDHAMVFAQNVMLAQASKVAALSKLLVSPNESDSSAMTNKHLDRAFNFAGIRIKTGDSLAPHQQEYLVEMDKMGATYENSDEYEAVKEAITPFASNPKISNSIIETAIRRELARTDAYVQFMFGHYENQSDQTTPNFETVNNATLKTPKATAASAAEGNSASTRLEPLHHFILHSLLDKKLAEAHPIIEESGINQIFQGISELISNSSERPRIYSYTAFSHQKFKDLGEGSNDLERVRRTYVENLYSRAEQVEGYEGYANLESMRSVLESDRIAALAIAKKFQASTHIFGGLVEVYMKQIPEGEKSGLVRLRFEGNELVLSRENGPYYEQIASAVGDSLFKYIRCPFVKDGVISDPNAFLEACDQPKIKMYYQELLTTSPEMSYIQMAIKDDCKRVCQCYRNEKQATEAERSNSAGFVRSTLSSIYNYVAGSDNN